MRVVLVDTGMGNLASVDRALTLAAKRADKSIAITASGDPDVVRHADVVVFPGQGAFRDCARALDHGLREALHESVRAGKPYLGLCLGLQILFVSSEEAPDPNSRGLGIFDGTVKRLHSAPGIKIPHMGWNTVEPVRASPFLSETPEHYYFVHSFAVAPTDGSITLATTTHGKSFVSAVAKDNVLAVQFHPEKSQNVGLELLRKFWSAKW